MKQTLHEVIRHVGQSTGKDISVYDESFLMKTIEKRVASFNMKNPREYCNFLFESEAEADLLLQSLNITYSEFFRNQLAFSLLEELVIPRLIEQCKKTGCMEIRVWSAGCSAGQEAYSIAMLLEETGIDFRIFATDSSTTDLETARQGVYTVDSLKNVRLKHLRKYYTQREDKFIINSDLSSRMNFVQYNLLDQASASPPESIYGDFDLVICANLLFYYKLTIRQAILTKIYHALSTGGYLVSGETERAMIQTTDGFRAIAPPAAVFQKVQR